MGLKPPAPQNLKKRLEFFLSHPELKSARWEVFNLSNQIINRDYLNRQIDRAEYINRMDALDRTQGWPEKESGMKLMGDSEFARDVANIGKEGLIG